MSLSDVQGGLMSLSNLSAPVFFVFVVPVLIAIVAWLVYRFSVKRFGGAAARKRQLRLAVMDAASVDSRRRLILIRRDNVEHLLIIGGPTDVVVETNIMRGNVAAPAREAAPVRAAAVADTTLSARPRAPPAARDYGEPRQQREKMASAAGSARR
jgi:flagellar biogenesis protein FliO